MGTARDAVSWQVARIVHSCLQVIDLTDPSVLAAPRRVRQRVSASQDTVEVVGSVRRHVNQAAGQPAQPPADFPVGVFGGIFMPGVAFQPHIAQAQAPAQASSSRAAVDAPAKSPGDDDTADAKCALCLDALKEDLCINPSCGHVFHYACMKASLVKFKACPRCRKKIPGEKTLKRIYM